MPKCPHCNYEVKEEDAIYNTKTKRYYHEFCYNELLERKKLCDYVCELLNYKKPSVRIYQQMTNYYERGVSYTDMLLALKYFYEIKKGDINKSQGGIGIIPYVLDEAKEFATLEKIKQDKLIAKFETNAIEKKETIIVHIIERNNKQRKNIDINTL
jgi:hypothetical protein